MSVSKRTRYEVLRRDNFTCRYCRSQANELTIDHVVPVSLGGSDDPSNLVAACRDCNAGKASSSPDAATITDVSEDALRWSSALKQAAEEITAAAESQRAVLAPFYAEFHAWLPGDWDVTVGGWLKSGLTIADATDCLGIALAKQYVRHDAVFAYACGIARNRIRAIQERAAAILAAPGGV